MAKIYRDTVLEIARGEIGYKEKATNKDLDSQTANAGSGNYTKYARDLWAANPHYYQGSKNGYDWCTIFVDWCIYMAADQDSKAAQKAVYYTDVYGASCTYSVGYYKAAGKFYSNPKPGDQIFFGSSTSSVNHTGLVEKVENGKVYTIEGNSGNQVRRREYWLSDSSIVGYGRPAYDGDSAPAPAPTPAPSPAPEQTSPSTGLPPFTDIEKGRFYYKAVLWAYANGIIEGTTATTFEPDKPCTRAEIVTMLYRYHLREGGGG